LTYSVLSAAIFSSRRGISTGLVSKSSQPAAIALSRSALIASPILRGSTLIMMQAANLREGNNVIACRSLASRGKVRQGHQGTCQQPEIVVDKPSVLRHGQSRSDGTQHRAGTAGEVHDPDWGWSAKEATTASSTAEIAGIAPAMVRVFGGIGSTGGPAHLLPRGASARRSRMKRPCCSTL
jgi:hypothetical protein